MSDGLRNRKTPQLPGVETLEEWNQSVTVASGDDGPLFEYQDNHDDNDDESSTTPLMGSTINSPCRKIINSVMNAEHAAEDILWTAFLKLDDTWERLVHHRNHEESTEEPGRDLQEEDPVKLE